MNRKAPRPFRASLTGTPFASPTESLRASASDSGDLFGTVRGSSAFVLQPVVFGVRPLESHVQQFRLSRSCSELLCEGGSASRLRRFKTRSAPGLVTVPVLRSTVAGGDRRFEHRWREAELMLSSSNAVGLQRSRSKPVMACEGDPSRTQTRTGRPTPSLQRTPNAISGYNGLQAGVASRSFGSLRRGAR
jgi:hypothetical protein